MDVATAVAAMDVVAMDVVTDSLIRLVVMVEELLVRQAVVALLVLTVRLVRQFVALRFRVPMFIVVLSMIMAVVLWDVWVAVAMLEMAWQARHIMIIMFITTMSLLLVLPSVAVISLAVQIMLVVSIMVLLVQELLVPQALVVPQVEQVRRAMLT